MARTRKEPAVAFKFAENTTYKSGERLCEITFDRKSLEFRFDRWGQTMCVKMSNEDFDAFQTWYQIARKFNQEVAPVLDTSE